MIIEEHEANPFYFLPICFRLASARFPDVEYLTKDNCQSVIQTYETNACVNIDNNGQVCVNIDNNLDESESDIFQSAPTQDDNNRDGGITIRDFNNENNNCNDRSTTCINQGEGDNKIGDVNFD